MSFDVRYVKNPSQTRHVRVSARELSCRASVDHTVAGSVRGVCVVCSRPLRREAIVSLTEWRAGAATAATAAAAVVATAAWGREGRLSRQACLSQIDLSLKPYTTHTHTSRLRGSRRSTLAAVRVL